MLFCSRWVYCRQILKIGILKHIDLSVKLIYLQLASAKLSYSQSQMDDFGYLLFLSFYSVSVCFENSDSGNESDDCKKTPCVRIQMFILKCWDTPPLLKMLQRFDGSEP